MEAERKLRDVLPLLDKAESCGIDCAGHRAVVQDRIDRLESFKREFLTPPPPL